LQVTSPYVCSFLSLFFVVSPDFRNRLIKALLTANEYSVLSGIFVLGYTETELARMNGKTRQNIHQAKMKALKKLKKYMTGE